MRAERFCQFRYGSGNRGGGSTSPAHTGTGRRAPTAGKSIRKNLVATSRFNLRNGRGILFPSAFAKERQNFARARPCAGRKRRERHHFTRAGWADEENP